MQQHFSDKRIDPPQDCFFSPGGNATLNRYPGWAIAFVDLPSTDAQRFYLVRNQSGETRWLQRHQIWFRGECPEWKFSAYESFDWRQIERLNQLPIDYRKQTNLATISDEF